jgi:enoyl-[acyl-carrier protein] reductase I
MVPWLEGKKGLILGVANQRSIAWAIARSTAGAGARLAFAYQGERLEEGVRSLAATIPGSLVLPCDVTRDEEIDALFSAVGSEWGALDFVVHSVAFAPRQDLEGAFAETSREGFRIALDVSAYSLAALARRAAPLMTGPDGGSLIALTYIGAVRAVPGYNVMGVAKAALESAVRYLALDLGPRNIRVNAISAGPINTLAARGVSGFSAILSQVRERAPLRRNTEASEVGDVALVLASPLSRGITGDVLYVDSGFHILGI